MKKSYSWLAVVVMFFIFYPIGIYMLIRNIIAGAPQSNTSKKATGIGYFVGGGIVCFIGFFAFINALNYGTAVDYFIALMFLIAGGGLIYAGLLAKKRQKLYSKYIRVIENYKRLPLENLAAMIPVAIDTATADVEKIVDAGLISGLFIDYSTRDVVNPSAENDFYSSVEYLSTQKVIIKCKSCLASNEVPRNNPGRCQYCNSPLV